MNNAGLHALPADGGKASMNTARAPVSSARDIPARSSPDRPAAAERIHSTIDVTIATATSDATPAIASAARSHRVRAVLDGQEHADGHRDRGGHPGPHPLQRIPAARHDQEGDENHHDDAYLQALAQADQPAAETWAGMFGAAALRVPIGVSSCRKAGKHWLTKPGVAHLAEAG